MKAREVRELVAKICSWYMVPRARLMYFADQTRRRLIYNRAEDGVNENTIGVYLDTIRPVILLERNVSRETVLHELAHYLAHRWGWETANTLHGKGFHRVFRMLKERF